MKRWQIMAFGAGATMFLLGAAKADIVPDYAVSGDPAAISTNTVVVPAVVTTTTTVPNVKRERDGDWYVVRGTADLERSKNVIRVKDNDGNLTELIYGDNVRIYRRGQPVSYLDVNSGDWVTVRYKGT